MLVNCIIKYKEKIVETQIFRIVINVSLSAHESEKKRYLVNIIEKRLLVKMSKISREHIIIIINISIYDILNIFRKEELSNE